MFSDILSFHEFTMKLGMLIFLCQRDSYWNSVTFLMTPSSTLSYQNKVLFQIAWYILQTCVHYSNFSFLLLSKVQLTSSLGPFLGADRNRVKTSRNLVHLRFLKYSSVLHPSLVALTLGGFGTDSCLLTHLQGLHSMPEDQNSEIFIKLNWYFSVLSNVQN